MVEIYPESGVIPDGHTALAQLALDPVAIGEGRGEAS